MPNRAVRESCARIEAALGSNKAFQKVEPRLYVVKQGSAYVMIQVIPWNEKALVRLVAQLVRGVSMTEKLSLRLLKLNARLRFGAFGYVEDGHLVTFTHTLLGGDTLDREELDAALRDVALLADEWDDKLAQEAGGDTFAMVLEDESMAAVGKKFAERGPWQKN